MPEQNRERRTTPPPAINLFSGLLVKLDQGETTLEVVHAWLANKLRQPEVSREALLREIDNAIEAGLLMPIARRLQQQINAALPGIRAADSEPGELASAGSAVAAPAATRASNDTYHEAKLSVGTGFEKERGTHTGDLVRTLEDGTTQLNRTDSRNASTQTEASGATWITGSNLRDNGGEPWHTVGVGSVLKQRFELVAAIGEGGMGTVYKARDLLKVEAHDRNPYIAVKLLSGDFRRHPEAFIALQREASKAQRLAHPNIATVYDFDRDGTTVYMTMELMQGEELAQYIKKLPPGGLAANAAMALIEQLCSGLSYAHKSGLVHADLKPGNAFLNHDGRVKLLDFGIARASKVRYDSSAGAAERTVFDPVSLGALTPAYATIEMFEAKPPDPRDDIYALACVAYELLSAEHPFDKLSALKIKAQNRKPKPLAKLDKRQNRALLTALAQERHARTPTVDQFWQALKPRKNRYWRLVVAGVVLASMTAGLSYTPLTTYLQNRRHRTLLTTLAHGAPPEVNAALTHMKTLAPQARRDSLMAIKAPLISYFETRAEAAVNADRGHYNFPAALAAITRAAHYYPDSARILGIKRSLKMRRNELVNRLGKRFSQDLDAAKIMPIAGQDITDVITKLAAAAPHSPLLHDPRLSASYADLAERAIANKKNRRAESIVQRGLAYAPLDPGLNDLVDELREKQKARARARRIATLKRKLHVLDPHLVTLFNYRAVRDDLLDLRRLAPVNPILAQFERPLRALVRIKLQQGIYTRHWRTAEAALRHFAPFFPVKKLLWLRRRLSAAEVAAGYQPPSMRARLAQISARRRAIKRLLAKPRFSAAWRARLTNNFKQLIALKQTGETWLIPLRRKIAHTFILRARHMLDAQRFNAAQRLLEHARAFTHQSKLLAHTRQALASARRQYQQARSKRLKTARINALKNQLTTQAKVGEVGAAKRTLEALAGVLGDRAPYISKTGPAIIARGYLRLARARAKNGDYRGAVQLTGAGLQLAPNLKRLQQAHLEFTRAAQRQALAKRADTLTRPQLPTFKRQLEQLADRWPPNGKKALRETLLARLAERIQRLVKDHPVPAHQLLAAARSAFPASRDLAELKLPALTPAERASQAPQQAKDGSRPCTAALAGYGRKARAECFDMVGPGAPGPILVVVPHQSKAGFAIGKYEISVSQYNRYCHQARACRALPGHADLPATGLTFQQATHYVAWLSKKTRRHYTIPTRAQWLHAARAHDPGAVSDFNCRVTVDDETLKGLSLVEITTGKTNPWGLVNYVGNAQEWVTTPHGAQAMGGDFKDSLAKCSIELTRQVDSDNLAMTGLRIARAIAKTPATN